MTQRGTIVVTGAQGFIGSTCVEQLRAKGWQVRGLTRTLDGEAAVRAELLPVGDLAVIDDRSLAHALSGAAAVVHLAARVHRPREVEATDAYRRINVDLTQRLARAAVTAGAGHFVFASSVKVNGESTQPGHPLREDDPPDPHDDYARSKWAAELALAAVAQESGLRVTSLRLPLTYGPGAGANFAALARAVRRGLPLPFAAIDNRRSILAVGNCCSALDVVLGSDNLPDRGRATPYFVADAEAVATPELVRAIAQAMRVAPRLFALPPALLRFAGVCVGRADVVERLLGSLEVDTTAFCARFGWAPPVSRARAMAAAVSAAAPL
ncbi:MAG: NAD-dependent epimerase/dehydratase family protein [Burkholderiales bacterium]|nr:NAD-dependent epimerase/dehydratase family protein [Burkholderiales bacterium]